VFINVCKHSELAVPAIKKKLDENGEEVEGMNIPLSAGPARSGMDKSGVACVIYDVIVNPQVIEDVFSDQTGRHRDFICQLAIQSIEQKNKLVLDKRYKLPKVRYMGEIASQHIQDRKNMPNIQEMSSSQSPGLTAASSTSKKAAGKADKEPIAEPLVEKPLQFQLKWKRIGGLMDEVEHEEGEAAGMQFNPPLTVPDDDVTHVVFLSTFDISSDAISQNDVQVSLSPYRIQVKVPGYLLAAAYFPCAVHSGDTFGSSTSASLGDET
ncbi:pih1d1, partial [Symbiodinium microadriaticum]